MKTDKAFAYDVKFSMNTFLIPEIEMCQNNEFFCWYKLLKDSWAWKGIIVLLFFKSLCSSKKLNGLKTHSHQRYDQ